MNAVDTNVLIYAVDLRDPAKWATARELIRRLRSSPVTTLLLWQAAGELLKYLRDAERRGEITAAGIVRYLRLFRRFFPLVEPKESVLDRAIDLYHRHSLSHWDSMLVAACIEAGVDTLYTEDMGAPRQIESVRLVNPFVP
jgi:predicted nucleic acid-binding protein